MRFPIGGSVTLEQLDREPHPVLARLRQDEPVSWIPALDGWLVTRHDLAVQAMRDPAMFTVEDQRFSTARVIGPSMLSLDGEAHLNHRTPFAAPFRPLAVRERFARLVETEAEQLLVGLRPAGAAELRRSFAGPLAASIVVRALGLRANEIPSVLDWYDSIVSAVTAITAGRGVTRDGEEAVAQLSDRLTSVFEAHGNSLLAVAAAGSKLTRDQIVSNAAVLLFGGIETTEGMISNAALHLLERPDQLELVRRQPGRLDGAIEESLRLEPAAAVIDRYAVADSGLDGAEISRGQLVRISIAAANRDPAVFDRPDEFDPGRRGVRGHLAFAQGPHICLGVHLARLEARIGLEKLVGALPALRLDPQRPSHVRGLVFRKPPSLHVLWDA